MAKIRINPDRDIVEFVTPEGEAFQSDEDAFDNFSVIAIEDGPAYLAVVGDYEGLKSNTIYRLTEVPTELEEDAVITDEDILAGFEEEEDDEAEEDD